jgi:hypothetical protein
MILLSNMLYDQSKFYTYITVHGSRVSQKWLGCGISHKNTKHMYNATEAFRWRDTLGVHVRYSSASNRFRNIHQYCPCILFIQTLKKM